MEENLISLCRKHHNEAEARTIMADQLRALLTHFFGYQYDANGYPLTHNGQPIQEVM